jgi:predicted nucleic acid-binding Zn ribbon protein
MPIYVYKNLVTNETFEFQQRITEDALTVDPRTGDPVKRLIQPVGIAFKGSGFYVNDSRGAGSSVKTAASAGSSASEGTAGSSAASGDSATTSTTSDAGSSSPGSTTSSTSAGGSAASAPAAG